MAIQAKLSVVGWLFIAAGGINLAAGFSTGRRSFFLVAMLFFAAGVSFFLSSRRRR